MSLDPPPLGGLELSQNVDDGSHALRNGAARPDQEVEARNFVALPQPHLVPMKWIAFAAALLFAVPFCVRQASRSSGFRKFLVGLIAFDLLNPQHINIVSDALYRGDSRGIEVTSVDLMVLSLFAAQRLRRVRVAVRPRFLLVRILYFAAVVLSLTGSPDMERSFYSIWKIARMFFAFSVLADAFVEVELLQAALWGLGLGVLGQGLLALDQKYMHHMVRVLGSQAHPNSLAMLVNLIMPVAFALILAGRARWIASFVVLAAAMCDIFTLSRAGMLMFGCAAAIVAVGSLLRGVNLRKVAVLSATALAASLVMAKSAGTIIQRFTDAPKTSVHARELFNAAAEAMANNHLFGVGVNMFSFVLDHGGYADRLGIESGDRNGIAHHIYWLTAAETGYPGLVAYALLLGAILVAALREARRPGLTGDIALGLMAGLVAMYAQGLTEWVARQTTVSYCFWMFAAMISAFYATRTSQDRRAIA